MPSTPNGTTTSTGDRAAPGTTGADPADLASSWSRAVAHLDPLPGRDCVVCLAPAVLGTPDGFRCATHEPTWGRGRVRWDTPAPGRYCSARCYCGRCAHYQVVAVARPAPRTAAAEVALAELRARNDARHRDGR